MGIIKGIANIVCIAVEKIKKAFVYVKDALTRYFSLALKFLNWVVDYLVGKVRGVILFASHFVRKIGNKYQQGIKAYSLDQELGKWYETTKTVDMQLEEVPEKYRTLETEFYEDDTSALDAVLSV